MPFSRRGEVRVGTLATGHEGFPFGLSGQRGKAGHVFFPVKFIYRVANHKDMVFKTIDLHVEDTDLALAFNDFGPNMSMNLTIFLDEIGVVDEF